MNFSVCVLETMQPSKKKEKEKKSNHILPYLKIKKTNRKELDKGVRQ